MGIGTLLPVHITVLFWALVPAAFAYAILQHQLWGIRRLVHRGMVYALVSMVLLASFAITVALLTHGESVGGVSPIMLAGLMVAGILLFAPMRTGARWLVDNFLYRDTLDYEAALRSMQTQLSTSKEGDVGGGALTTLVDVLRLEAALFVRGEGHEADGTLAMEGERAGELRTFVQDKLANLVGRATSEEMFEIQWGSEYLLVAGLRVPERLMGLMILGPKRGGEVFVEQERRLVATLAPVLALAIDKRDLSEELRELSQQLLTLSEKERALLAADLHDGPLQKALLLTRSDPRGQWNPQELAAHLVAELRELCSRLRPSILDDLGLAPSVEWLLEQLSANSNLITQLTLVGFDEWDRFDPAIEQALFRIAQEASNNTLKHANASQFDVVIKVDESRIVLEASDNGKGFDLRRRRAGGLGLSGMRERVLQLHGTFEVKSRLGVGSAVIARIPLQQTQPEQAHEQVAAHYSG